MIEIYQGGIRITVIAQPKSSKNEVIGPFNGAVKIKIMAPPIEGRANEALIEYLSKIFDVSKRQVSLYRGDLSKHKIFQIEGVNKETAEIVLKIKK